jgi:hypothetical protein
MVNYLEPDYSDLPGRRVVPQNYKREAALKEGVDVSIITPYNNTEEIFF